jgi:hypothetical protein
MCSLARRLDRLRSDGTGRPAPALAPLAKALRADPDPLRVLALVGAENLCHQAIFMNHAPCAVTPLNPELIQVGDAIG